MKLIVASRADEASMNIRSALLKNYGFKKEKSEKEDDGLYRFKDLLLKTIDDMHIYHDDVDKEVETNDKIENVIFISKHSSEKAVDCLTCHPIGNFSEAEVGGRSFEIVPTDGVLMTKVVRNLQSSSYRVSFEATHHGPYLKTKTFFAEIGSDRESWNDEKKGETVAKALMEALMDNKKIETVVIGIGGGHYMPAPTEIVKRKKVAFSHMIPNYHLSRYKKCIDLILEKEDVKCAYLDKKAIKKQIDLSEIKNELKKRGIEEIDSKSLPSID